MAGANQPVIQGNETNAAEPAAISTTPAEATAEEIVAGPPIEELRFGRGKTNSERANRLLELVTANGFADNGRSRATASNGVDYDTVEAAKKVANSWKRDLSSVAPEGKRVAVAFFENDGKQRFALYLANKGKPRGKGATKTESK